VAATSGDGVATLSGRACCHECRTCPVAEGAHFGTSVGLRIDASTLCPD
jgi:hypothetical protein